jgi:hypothetical protein
MFSSHRNPIEWLSRCLCAAISCLILANGEAADGAVIFDDTFDVGAPPTRGDDADDPLDLQWYKSTNTVLSVVDDAPGIGSGDALNLDNSLSFGKFGGNVETVLLDDLGDAATLSFDFRG